MNCTSCHAGICACPDACRNAEPEPDERLSIFGRPVGYVVPALSIALLALLIGLGHLFNRG